MSRRAATLAEVLIAGALLVLILGLFAPLLWLTGNIWRAADATETAQSEALALVYRLQHDYRAALPGSLARTSGAGITQLSFLSFDPVVGDDILWSPQGRVLWKKWVQYRYRASAGRVERREVALPTPTTRPDRTPPLWPADQSAQTLAFHVTVFEVVPAPPDNPLLRVRLGIEVEKRTGGSEIRVLPRFYQCDTL